MNKPLVLIEEDHYLKPKIDENLYQILDAESEELLSDDLVALDPHTIIIDLTISSSEEKRQLLDVLQEEKAYVYSDLSTVWGEGLFASYTCLKGALALGYPSPKNCYEIYAPKEKDLKTMQNFLSAHDLQALPVSTPGLGFHFPRVLAQIINEAYFSLEEGLASAKAIDQAMLYGVNYPKGPLDWAKGVSLRTTINLLDELYAVTGEPRYRTSQALRLEFIKQNR